MGNMKLKKTERLQDYEKYYQSCYHWAKFFDSIDMAWVYCPDSGRESELDKAMDFYLPDQGAYFVVDLVRPGRCDVNYICQVMIPIIFSTYLTGITPLFIKKEISSASYTLRDG